MKGVSRTHPDSKISDCCIKPRFWDPTLCSLRPKNISNYPYTLGVPHGTSKMWATFREAFGKSAKNVIDNTSGQTQSKKVQPKHVLYIYILCYIFRFVLLILKYNYIIYIYLNLFESIKSTVKRTNVICHV